MIRVDTKDLEQELRVIREELRILKGMLNERLPERAEIVPPDHKAMRILTIKQVLSMIPITRSRMINYRRAGQFPKAINLGPKSEGFLERDILDWIEAHQQTQAEAA
jgi:prophage regulatory protein